MKINLPETNNCILEVNADREQFLKLKDNKSENILDKLQFFNSIYDYDRKKYLFKEITK